MHVQDYTKIPAAESTQTSVQEPALVAAASGNEEEKGDADDVDDALKEFQNTLKEVLSDEKGAENTMQSMEQMMQFLK